ncbi:hypothetical protein LCGC14_3010830, partial [marine sediment metagenome]
MALAVLSGLWAAPADAKPAFTRKPTVSAKDGQLIVRFGVSELTDVEVAVLDAGGKVVRHLAAGMLGENTPAGLQSGTLSQKVAWDGKNDLGKPVGGDVSAFKFRVSAGMSASLTGIIGSDPLRTILSVRGLTTDAEGNLYVLNVLGAQHSNDGTASVLVLDRKGKYLRTILPFPADLPPARLKGLKRITDEAGNELPFFYQLET